MTLQNVLRESWAEYRTHFLPLIRVTSPFLVAILLLGGVWYLQNLSHMEAIVAYHAGRTLLEVSVILVGLKYLFNVHGVVTKVTLRAILFTVLALAYTVAAVFVASLLFLVPAWAVVGYLGAPGFVGTLLYLVPGFIILTVAFLTPACVLIHKRDPLESVAASTSLIKGHILPVAGLLLAVFAAIVLVGFLIYGAYYFSAPLGVPAWLAGAVADILTFLITLFLVPLMRVLYTTLMEAREGEPLPLTAGSS